MKKVIIRVTLVLAGLALLAALVPSVMRWQFGVALRWHDAADYWECREEFNMIKDYVQSEYYDGETRRYFSVSGRLNGEIRMYDSLAGEYVDWPTDVMTAIAAADREGFPQGECSLDIIWVEKDRITFSSEGKAYRLVYMMEGRPDDGNGSWFVKRIGDGWYHVTVNPDA